MKQQTIDWAKDVLETCLKAMGSNKEESATNEIDVRYFHDIDSIDDESDIEDIITMSDDELNAELAALGITDDDIDESLTICTDTDIVSFPSKKIRQKDAAHLKDMRPKPISAFEDKLLTTLIRQAIDCKVNAIESPIYSQEAAGFNKVASKPTYVENNILPFLGNKNAQELVIREEQKDKTEYVFTERRKVSLSMVLSILTICTSALIVGSLIDDKPEVIKEKYAVSHKLIDNFPINTDSSFIEASTPKPEIIDYIQTSDVNRLSVSDSKTPSIRTFRNTTERVIAGRFIKTGYQEEGYLVKQTSFGNRSPISYAAMPKWEPVNTSHILKYDATIVFLDRISNGEIEATNVERLKILRKLLDVAKSDALQAELDGKGYESSNTCAAKGLYEHPVTKGDTISGIILDECLYKLTDSTLFDTKVTLKIGDIVVMNIGENRVVKKVTVSRIDGSISKVYNTDTP